MRQITKDIQITIDGSPLGFRLTKLDAFSGVTLLRFLMRLENSPECHPERRFGTPGERASGSFSVENGRQPRTRSEDLPAAASSAPTLLDLISSLSEEELRSVMTAVLNHVSVLLPAGPHPVMTGSEWGYPELEHDTPSCLKLLLEGIAWSLSGFFGGGRSKGETGRPDTAP